MNKILILFAHPALQKSRVHSALARVARDVEGVTFCDLYDRYPDFFIDVHREQQQLLDHDIILWQHPFYWYSCPALLKEWMDLVLEHNFAYGRQGTHLHGKKALTVLSTGGSQSVYSRKGDHHYSVKELLAPFHQTTRLCGMEYLAPFVVHGSHLLTVDEIEQYATDYRKLLIALRDGTLPEVSWQDTEYINHRIPS